MLFAVTGRRTLWKRVRRVRGEWRSLAVMAGVAALVVLPQLLIYYRATGRPIVSSYGSLGFNFGSPRIVGVLFGVQKGLFFWSPVLLLACAGFVYLWRSRHPARAFLFGSLVFLVVNTYLIASWWDWQFGGSFGHRGFTDALPVFALGLAGFYTWAGQRRMTMAAASGVLLLVSLSVFQMLQYWNHVLPFSDTTWDQYRSMFLRLH
jgi:hypothetical protein